MNVAEGLIVGTSSCAHERADAVESKMAIIVFMCFIIVLIFAECSISYAKIDKIVDWHTLFLYFCICLK